MLTLTFEVRLPGGEYVYVNKELFLVGDDVDAVVKAAVSQVETQLGGKVTDLAPAE